MAETAENRKMEIKRLILETLSITEVNINDIDDELPLFGGNNALTLDSVDALEIIMAIQRKFNVRITDQAQARYTIRSINSIEAFLQNEESKSHG